MTAGEAIAAFAALPIRPLDDILAPGPVLVLAPHPDDESIGCGGMVALASDAGRCLHIAVLTDGTGSHPGSPTVTPARLRALREAEARDAVAVLGIPPHRLSFLGQPDAHAPSRGPAADAVVARLAALVDAHGIGTLVTTWRHDPHCDHEAAAMLADAVARATGVRHLAFPVWGLTLPSDQAIDQAPMRGARLDIAAVLPRKRRAIAAHVSQTTRLIDDSPHGFQLPPEFLALFDRPWESFIDA